MKLKVIFSLLFFQEGDTVVGSISQGKLAHILLQGSMINEKHCIFTVEKNGETTPK